ncbi:hypothetical protein HYDPIDRAFT_117169 [Hydnomerulius pinastri MD-312]|uniref:G domain-containing protein n=1 Tax=Hydnomerulius pinastri MD-312 TaxID=994086 RepID=A0A0C9W2Z7_9AGAM|nr:hypothetical protein HYDPIDRAFT_117169 [Hydnomerulius pinastri MD-312]
MGPKHARNVVVFGETGVGKSSIINMVLQRDPAFKLPDVQPVAEKKASKKSRAKTSNNTLGCTSRTECYEATLPSGTRVKLWDTQGLDEGDQGTVQSAKALEELEKLLRDVASSETGIDLLLYCMSAGRAKKALTQNYSAIYEKIFDGKVPVALAITGLERQRDMHGWWINNRDKLCKLGLFFDAHACITAVEDHRNADEESRLDISRRRIIELVSREALDGHEQVCPGVGGIKGPHLNGIDINSRPFSFYELTHDHVVFAVIGPSGAGKSLFISKATGLSPESVGVGKESDLRACTEHVSAFKFTDPVCGKDIILIDTPGLDQASGLSDDEIVAKLSRWLQEMRKRKLRLAGMLYLHGLSDNYMTTTSMRHLCHLETICGANGISRVVAVSWDDMEQRECMEKLNELRSKVTSWRTQAEVMGVLLFLNTSDSAREVIRKCITT